MDYKWLIKSISTKDKYLNQYKCNFSKTWNMIKVSLKSQEKSEFLKESSISGIYRQ